LSKWNRGLDEPVEVAFIIAFLAYPRNQPSVTRRPPASKKKMQ
jgi:hypothetical protein